MFPYLQEEARTLWHEDHPDQGSQSREDAHQYEHPPAVELELCPDGETPAWNNMTQHTYNTHTRNTQH